MEGVGVTPSFWRGRRVLLTGHTGFKGAWLALWLDRLGAKVVALALPPEPDALWSLIDPPPAMRATEVDLRDAKTLIAEIREAEPEIVLHLAAQAIVRRGYREPVLTFTTNVQGSVNLLDALQKLDSVGAILVVTSDKVYDGTPGPRGFVETDPLGGKDPYSASKAACEMVVAAYSASAFADRGVAVATARAGNVVGGGDMGEGRLVPDLVRAIRSGTCLRIRSPQALRPWQHVLDPLYGYLLYVEELVKHPSRTPRALNFGPGMDSKRSVRDVIDRACAIWSVSPKIEREPAAPVEAEPLWVCSDLAKNTLGWSSRLSFDDALRWTVTWWSGLAEGRSARDLCDRQIAAYESLAG